MSKRDRQGVRTPAGLDQKYNLGGRFSKLEEQDAKQSREMTRQTMTIGEFIPYATSCLSRLDKEVAALRQGMSGNTTSFEKKLAEVQQSISQIHLTLSGINETLSKFDKRLGTLEQNQNAQSEV